MMLTLFQKVWVEKQFGAGSTLARAAAGT
jgi:hypothetical protein